MVINGERSDLRDFILRRLEDEERERLEEALFSDDVLFERLVDEENDLIDEWARGNLPDEQRRLVESIIGGTPRGAERLRFARSFTSKVDSTQTGSVVGFRRSAATWIPLAAAAAVTTVVVGLWIAQDRQTAGSGLEPVRVQTTDRPADRVPELPSEARQSPRETLAEAPAPAVPARVPAPAEVARLALSLAVVRGEATEPVVVLAPSQPLELAVRLDPQDRFDTYSIVVTGPDGSVVHSSPSVKPEPAAESLTVRSRIPASSMTEGVHEVAVSADGLDLGWITFRVRR